MKKTKTPHDQYRRNRILSYIRRKRPVFCIEGTWSGYSSGQSRVCHRIYSMNEDEAKAINEIRSIRFTDGTFLGLSATLIHCKEDVHEEIHGYDELIREVLKTGKRSVEEIQDGRQGK